MRKTLQMILVLTIALGAFALFSSTASADTAAQYREAMGPFAEDISVWGEDLTATAEAAVAKPELACGAELNALVRSGTGIHNDLAGTTDIAPAALQDSHVALTNSVAAMTRAADHACGDAAGAAAEIREARGQFDTALLEIRVFTDARPFLGFPGHTPDLPGSTN